VNSALAGQQAALYLPRRVCGPDRHAFHALHVNAARSCAEIASKHGLSRFAFISALGVDSEATAWSDQTKAEGEMAVRLAFPDAVAIRPSLVLGPSDHFSTPMTRLMRRMPLLPVIGPDTRVQPVHVDDLAEAACRLLTGDPAKVNVVQAAGPRIWRIVDLLAELRDQSGLRCGLLPLPELVAMILATAAGLLPNPPLCRDQVRLMRTDKISHPDHPDLLDLGITARDPMEWRVTDPEGGVV
jgi:uncharacterized protein YbjT (DUF2867 family)